MESKSQQRKGKVLLVDDRPDDLVYYAGVLLREGYDVRPLASFEEAAACVEREDFDLIIVSQGTREFEGRIVLSNIGKREDRPPVLVLTQSVDVECYLETVQLGGADYLEKPLAAAQMAQAVARYMRHGRSHA
jgi:DNA-binding NtrC family response regulator